MELSQLFSWLDPIFLSGAKGVNKNEYFQFEFKEAINYQEVSCPGKADDQIGIKPYKNNLKIF
ncbi:MAG: hypothetical protein U0W24_01800 [Bacteroidales bacterium]